MRQGARWVEMPVPSISDGYCNAASMIQIFVHAEALEEGGALDRMLKRGVSIPPVILKSMHSISTVLMNVLMVARSWGLDLLDAYAGPCCCVMVSIMFWMSCCDHTCFVILRTTFLSWVVKPPRQSRSAGGVVTVRGLTSKVMVWVDHICSRMMMSATARGMLETRNTFGRGPVWCGGGLGGEMCTWVSRCLATIAISVMVEQNFPARMGASFIRFYPDHTKGGMRNFGSFVWNHFSRRLWSRFSMSSIALISSMVGKPFSGVLVNLEP